MCMERLKTDLGVFPNPFSFAEVRSFAKAFPSARLASWLALGSVVSRQATDPPDWGMACVLQALYPLSHLSSSTFMDQLVNLYPFVSTWRRIKEL